MFSPRWMMLMALSVASLVAAQNQSEPLCTFTPPSSCGLSDHIIPDHLKLSYLAPSCCIDPPESSTDPHAGHDMRRRLYATPSSSVMEGWECDANRTALGCSDATILHTMMHGTVQMTHYMAVCMPSKISSNTDAAQQWWNAKVAADNCTTNCADARANKVRVTVALENGLSGSKLDDVMNYINKAAMACSAATSEAACSDAANTVAMMSAPTDITSSASTPLASLFVFLLMGLAMWA